MFERRKKWLVFLALLIVAAAFRIAVAYWLANDNPEDGKVYAQIARNVIEQHVYSHETEAPYDPSLIRVPGYPLFLAAIYRVFGHTNNGAVRIVQALIDTGTCALVALLAFLWQPDERRKIATAIAALALAAVNPFTTIYAATILTEVPTMFLALATCVAATMALRADDAKRSLTWWSLSGLLAGLGAMFRPDSGLFVAAIGLILLLASLRRFWSTGVLVQLPSRVGRGIKGRGADAQTLTPTLPQRGREPNSQSGVALRLPPHSIKGFRHTFAAVAIFFFAFLLVLTPWTVRNRRVFHLFQPLAPMHAEMPAEFVPRGYIRWLKTWVDDQQYIDPFWWELNIQPMAINDLPDSAFDSDGERDRVEALLDQYNHPSGVQTNADTSATQQQPSPTPLASPTQTPANPKTSTVSSTPTPKSPPQKKATSNANAAENTGDENDQNNNSNDQEDENDEEDQSDQSKTEPHGPVQMTPEIDAAFGEIARERIARHPLRYYVWLPTKRAHVLWFNTHSDFYPFEGALFPLDELDYEAHQHIWLSLFAVLVGIYTLFGLAGGFALWTTRDFYARSWALLVALIIVTRLGFFSSVESPEPRYVVEFFPFLAALGGIAIARVSKRSM